MLFTENQSRQALWRLSLFHILIIASSNYLVQLPIEILGVHTTWGAFSFPFIFLATDLTAGAPYYFVCDVAGLAVLIFVIGVV